MLSFSTKSPKDLHQKPAVLFACCSRIVSLLLASEMIMKANMQDGVINRVLVSSTKRPAKQLWPKENFRCHSYWTRWTRNRSFMFITSTFNILWLNVRFFKFVARNRPSPTSPGDFRSTPTRRNQSSWSRHLPRLVHSSLGNASSSRLPGWRNASQVGVSASHVLAGNIWREHWSREGRRAFVLGQLGPSAGSQRGECLPFSRSALR